MKRRKWTRRAALRYFMIQVPGWAAAVVVLVMLRYWLGLPMLAFWSILFLWILKDFVMFPLLWRAYDGGSDEDSMNGLRGRAEERLSPSGHVRVQGERWRARLAEGSPPIEAGDTVIVRGRKGLTLIVQGEE